MTMFAGHAPRTRTRRTHPAPRTRTRTRTQRIRGVEEDQEDQEDFEALLAMEAELTAPDMDIPDDVESAAAASAAAAEPAAGASSSSSGAAEDVGATGAQEHRWLRPDVDPDFHPSTSNLAFQWTAIDMESGEPLPTHPGGAGRRVPGSTAGL